MVVLQNIRPWEKIVKIIKVHRISYFLLWIQVLWTFLLSTVFHYLLGFTALSFLLTTMLWIISLITLYIEWLNYELDTFIITNNRIIWIEQISFLNRTVSECNLAQVQEVNSQTKWFFANLFNYWDLSIQTAWNITKLTMRMCPDPIHEAWKILNIIEEYKEDKIKKIENDIVPNKQ